MNEHLFRGLSAENPLGFLAALGTLRALDDHAVRSGIARPRLGFVDQGVPFARIVTPLERAEIDAVLLEDAERDGADPMLRLAYDDEGRAVEPEAKGATRDLKPSPALARVALGVAARGSRRTADYGAAFFSDVVTDNNGRTKPTAFHFTAGQMRFLKMLEELRSGLRVALLGEALDGPWSGESTLPSLTWDSTSARKYALRAVDPSVQKRGSVPAANWLAAVGLTFLPVVARKGALRTTGVEGGWKDGAFCWPLWDGVAGLRTVRSVLSLDWSGASRATRGAVGVRKVLRCRIVRADQGGNGSFAPAETVLPG